MATKKKRKVSKKSLANLKRKAAPVATKKRKTKKRARSVVKSVRSGFMFGPAPKASKRKRLKAAGVTLAQSVAQGLVAAGAGVVVTLGINNIPVVKDQSAVVKSGAQLAISLLAMLLAPKNALVRSAAVGNAVLGTAGMVKALTGFEALAEHGGVISLSAEEIRAIQSGEMAGPLAQLSGPLARLSGHSSRAAVSNYSPEMGY